VGAQRLRYLMIAAARRCLTTQQAVLLTLVRVLKQPSLTEAATRQWAPATRTSSSWWPH